MRINKDGKTHEVIDNIKDARPGDRLESPNGETLATWTNEGCWRFVGRLVHELVHEHKAINALLKCGARIIREVEEKKVWRVSECWIERKLGVVEITVTSADYEAAKLLSDNSQKWALKAWPQGTPEPLPENVAEFVRKKAIEGFLGARELVEEYGL